MSRKDEVARHLARTHFDIEPGMVRIFRITGSADAESSESEPIKLLEVNEATVSAGVLPLHFAPMPKVGVTYSTIIISVTPEEFEKLESQELKLPKDWTVGQELTRPVVLV